MSNCDTSRPDYVYLAARCERCEEATPHFRFGLDPEGPTYCVKCDLAEKGIVT
jgi:hypothetical protein